MDDITLVIENELSNFPQSANQMANMAMVYLLKKDEKSALNWMNKAIEANFISDDWLTHQPIFQSLYERGLLDDILNQINRITENYRSQVQESGVLQDNAMHLDKNIISQ